MTTTLNPADKNVQVTLSGGNLTASITTDPGHPGAVRATAAITSGKIQFEVSIDTLAGFICVGLMTSTGDLGDIVGAGVGIGLYDLGFSSQIFSGGVAGDEFIGAIDGSIIGVNVDESAEKCWFSVDGVFPDGHDPTTGDGGYDISSLLAVDCYPAVGADVNNFGSVLTINFGATPFSYPTSGFSGLDGTETTWVPKLVWF